MNNIVSLRFIKTFGLILFIVMMFNMSLKNNNDVLSSYDIPVCMSLYSSVIIYPIIPYIYIKHLRSYQNVNCLIRYGSINRIWFKSCMDALLKATELTLMIAVSGFVTNAVVSYSVFNWNDKESIFCRITFSRIEMAPSIWEIMLPVIVFCFLNILLIELVTLVTYWYINMYWIGYAFVVVGYTLPSIPGFKYSLNRMCIAYEDMLVLDSIKPIWVEKAVVLVGSICIMILVGLVRKRKDFIR